LNGPASLPPRGVVCRQSSNGPLTGRGGCANTEGGRRPQHRRRVLLRRLREHRGRVTRLSLVSILSVLAARHLGGASLACRTVQHVNDEKGTHESGEYTCLREHRGRAAPRPPEQSWRPENKRERLKLVRKLILKALHTKPIGRSLVLLLPDEVMPGMIIASGLRSCRVWSSQDGLSSSWVWS
jgi:hypothetical protein